MTTMSSIKAMQNELLQDLRKRTLDVNLISLKLDELKKSNKTLNKKLIQNNNNEYKIKQNKIVVDKQEKLQDLCLQVRCKSIC